MDVFLLLTPILVLAVVALVGFVGCDVVFGLGDVTTPLPAPTNLVATPGNGKVDLAWTGVPVDLASTYRVKRGLMPGGPYTTIASLDQPQTTFTDTSATNGTRFFYVVTAVSDTNAESAPSNEASATPAIPPTSFVTSENLGTIRNNFTGFVGMAIQVSASPLTIRALGRFVAPGNSNTHVMKIVDASTAVDVPNGIVTVNTAGVPAGTFAYTALPAPIALNAGATYYVVSQETQNLDAFYDNDTTVQTTAVGTVTSAVFSPNGSNYTPTGAAGLTYGPVDFQY